MGCFVSKSEPQTPPQYYAPLPTVIQNERNNKCIPDEYETLEQVTLALRRNGLESSNLIVGIDFTKSNDWTGKNSFNGKSLHSIGVNLNPYEQAISIIGRTLSSFDEDNLIPCFGFGDISTHDKDVFSFYPENRICYGFEETLKRYREIVPSLCLSGPTSFAPIIRAAIEIVEESGGQYHILLIVADGQVTEIGSSEPNTQSPQEKETIAAIVEASKYALSIVLVGVGDGPWDMMKTFDDNIPDRRFDNFQFVNFTEIMQKKILDQQKEALFALSALMEIPEQFKATMVYNVLNRKMGKVRTTFPLPPPKQVLDNDTSVPPFPRSKMSYSNSGSEHEMPYKGASKWSG